jgi:hypothetical protein
MTMKKIILKTIATLILIGLLFVGCKKSNHVKTNTELLTQSSWKFDHATASGFGDISAQIPACYKDNVVAFVSNGTGTVDESTNVCSPSNAGAFTWSFQTNETMLHLSTALFSGGNGDFTIVSLNETNLVVSQQVILPPPNSMQVTAVFTFKH